jgi:hypothetical protein
MGKPLWDRTNRTVENLTLARFERSWAVFAA